MLRRDRLKPSKRLVLAEALFIEETPGGLAIPPEAQERYPFIGRVVNIGPDVREDIREGDIAVFSTEMFDAPNTYADFFSVILRDGLEDVEIFVDIEVEPIFHDQMKEYEKSPTENDRWIQLLDIQTDVAYKFLASDVIAFGPANLQVSSVQKLRYVNTRMFSLEDDEGREVLHYLIEEREIEAVIR